MSQMNNFIQIEISKNEDESFSARFSKTNTNHSFELATEDQLRTKILPKITQTDPGITRRLGVNETFIWKINCFEHRATSKRLQRIIPYVCRPKHLEQKLYPYQKDGIDWLLEAPHRLLADDMGLGKTVQVLLALQKKIFRDLLSLNILLAPVSLIKSWEAEAKSWTPNLILKIVTPETFKSSNAQEAIFFNANLILCPYSLSSKLVEEIKKSELNVDQLICDEAHKLRKSNSQTNNAVRKIKAESRWFVTGTPLERDETDIVNILTILHPQKTFEKDGSSSTLLRSNLMQATLRRQKKDVLPELPQVQKFIHEITLSAEQETNYQKIKEKLLKLPHDQRISMITALCLATCQTVNNTNKKVEKALEIANERINPREKVIVFSNFNRVLNDCQKMFSSNDMSCLMFTGNLDRDARNRVLFSFKNNADKKILLLNSRVGGEGLNLTEANNVIFLNEWWNPSSNRQAEDRINRIGQEKCIYIHVIRAINTIDSNVAKIIDSKIDLEQTFLVELLASLN